MLKRSLPFIAAASLALISATACGDDDAKPAAATASKTSTVAKIGETAPDFTLKSIDGKSHRLADLRGKNVVLQWINPDCPVCVRVSSTGVLKRTMKQLDQIDPEYVHLAINSTNYMEPSKSVAYLKSHELDIVALDDRDGKVGHLYGAKTTPHMYVIDGQGVLRYAGAIDDDSRGTKGDAATNYVVNAMTAITSGETVAPDTTRSYGCSVKYAKGGGEAGRADRPERGARGERGQRGDRRKQMMERYDTDGDGQLSEEERAAMRAEREKQMLERYDADGDGELSDEERAKAREEMRGRRGGGGQGERNRGGNGN